METKKLYIRTPLKNGQEYTICDEITDEVYASTDVQSFAIIIKEALLNYINNEKKEVEIETKKLSSIKHWPSNFEIFDTEGGAHSLSYDGLKGYLTREEWKRDEVIQQFDLQSQEEILNQFDFYQITKE